MNTITMFAEFAHLPQAATSPLWPQSRASLDDLRAGLLAAVERGEGKDFRARLTQAQLDEAPAAGVAMVDQALRARAYYGDIFWPAPESASRLNERLTRAAQRQGGRALQSLMLRALLRMQKQLPPSAHLVLKGSKPVSMLLAAACADHILPLFQYGDLDAEVLIDPALRPDRFELVHRTVRLAGMDALAWLKEQLDRTGLGEELATAASCLAATPIRRRSFLLQRVFEPSPGEHLPPPTGVARPQHVQLFTELEQFKTTRGLVDVPPTSVYCSANTLHFLNCDRQVHFSLLRCMMAFRREINGQRLHAELLDISIPRQHNSQLTHKWDDLQRSGTIAVPELGGTRGLRCFSLDCIYRETKASVSNSQKHKAERRRQRLVALQELFREMEDGELLRACKLQQRRKRSRDEALAGGGGTKRQRLVADLPVATADIAYSQLLQVPAEEVTLPRDKMLGMIRDRYQQRRYGGEPSLLWRMPESDVREIVTSASV